MYECKIYIQPIASAFTKKKISRRAAPSFYSDMSGMIKYVKQIKKFHLFLLITVVP